MSQQTAQTAAIDNAADLAALVKDCAKSGRPIVDYGIAHAGVGYPPPAEHVRLQFRAASPVVEHYVADLTARLHTGATMGAIQAALAEHNQFLPIDADDDLTLGEVIAHNVYGPLRLGYGGVRDMLLGLHYIDGEGRDIHVGGRTVKNVAGLDVSRFMVGSLGELGLIHQATLRTWAIPERVTVVEMTIDDPEKIDAVLTNWLTTDAAPVAMTLRSPSAASSEHDGAWSLLVRYAGKLSGCMAQLQSLETFADSVPMLHIVNTSDATLAQDTAERAAERAWRRNADALVKLIVPPASAGAACSTLLKLAESPGHHGLRVEAMPAHGCIFVGGPISAGEAMELDRTIQNITASLGGFRVWYAHPAGAGAVEPFAPPQTDATMIARLKDVMDPHCLFNPGRSIRREARP